MGLFGLGKKNREPTKSSPTSTENEFDRDIRELLARDDITCRPEICAAEYKKACSLLEGNPTESKIHRAYDIMGRLASEFEYGPACQWMGDFAESVKQDLSEACYWYKRAADSGDGNGARCYADMLMVGNGVQQNPQEAFKYYSIAADKGVPEAAFVMGEFFRNYGKREEALRYYKKAVEGGYSNARIRIDQMKNGQR